MIPNQAVSVQIECITLLLSSFALVIDEALGRSEPYV